MRIPSPPAESSAPLPRHRLPVRRQLAGALTVAAALAAASWGGHVAALGLGEVAQQSALGQALRIVIPIITSPGDDLSGECFKLVPGRQDDDGIPPVLNARLTLETTAARPRLVLTSPRGVTEPIVRVAVQAGCDVTIQREYTLLMDPMPIEAPTVAVEAAAPAAAAAAAPPAAAGEARAPTAAGDGRGTPGATARPGPRAGAAAPPAAKRAAAKPRAKAPARSARPSTVVVPPPAPPPAPEKAQLKLSRAAPGGSRDADAAKEATALPTLQSQEELANALEAETVVLRQRVAELSQSIERMQREMAAAQAARVAAEEAAKASPWTTAARWWEGNWPFIAALIGLASLIAAGLLYRRRRNVGTGEWPIGAQSGDSFESTYMNTAVPGATEAVGPRGAEVDTSQGVPGSTAPAAKPARGYFGAGDGANALAVSELSQVTEEARVFLQLGHVDRAMEVLREHIDQQPRSMPAAWLMLLDLYRTNGREQDFRKLAEEFHLQFNAQTPLWTDAQAAEGSDTGLEGFPHIVKQLTGSWGKVECRDFLERLLYDNRKGRRTGFSFRAFTEILTLRQLIELVLADIDSDVAEEQKVRAAWAAATALPAAKPGVAAAAAATAGGSKAAGSASPITLDLDLDLEIPAPGDASPKPPRK
jgi:hypothetical protein